jgi:hypothetical protein
MITLILYILLKSTNCATEVLIILSNRTPYWLVPDEADSRDSNKLQTFFTVRFVRLFYMGFFQPNLTHNIGLFSSADPSNRLSWTTNQ